MKELRKKRGSIVNVLNNIFLNEDASEGFVEQIPEVTVSKSVLSLEKENIKREKSFLKEASEEYSREIFVNALSEIVLEALPLDDDYKGKNKATLRKKISYDINQLLENNIINLEENGNFIIQELYEGSKLIGESLAKEYLKGKNKIEFEAYKNDLFSTLMESAYPLALDGINITRELVEKTFKNEVERANKIAELTATINEEATLVSANAKEKINYGNIKKLNETAKPTLYETINKVISKRYLIENSNIENYTEQDMDNIISESLRLFTLVETLNVFKLLDINTAKLNKLLESYKVDF
jgi:hypothetical protein